MRRTTLQCKAPSCVLSWNHQETIWNNHLYTYPDLSICMPNSWKISHPSLFTSSNKPNRANGHNNASDPPRGFWLFFRALSPPWSRTRLAGKQVSTRLQSPEIWEQMGDNQETKFEINKWMQVDISGCYLKLKSCQNAAVYNYIYIYDICTFIPNIQSYEYGFGHGLAVWMGMLGWQC